MAERHNFNLDTTACSVSTSHASVAFSEFVLAVEAEMGHLVNVRDRNLTTVIVGFKAAPMWCDLGCHPKFRKPLKMTNQNAAIKNQRC